jgi:serine/threonine-protein kinase
LLLAAAGFAGYYVYTKIQDQLDAAKPVQVPFVEGQSEPIARANIRRAELVPVVKRMPSNTVAAGKVFEQNPKGGEGTDKGNQVTLTVSTGKPKTTVPDVRGKPIADAAVALDNAGLKYHQVAVHSAEEPGTVTGQNPPPGTQVLVGDTVRINVSQGPAPVSVPNVVGMSADAATSTLRNLGFAVVTTQVDSDEPAGTVVETIPSHDTSVQPGTTVTLKLSKGPQTTAVPDVTGLDQSTAVELLRSYGFKARITKVTTSSETEDARVLAQIPASGSQANPGSSVDLTVGKYVAPAPPPPPPVQTTPTTPADTGPVLIPPTDTGPVQTSPTDTGPVQTSPTDTGPVQMPPTDTTPTDTIPTDTTPTDTTPTDTEPPSTDTTPTTTVPASPPPSPPSVP